MNSSIPRGGAGAASGNSPASRPAGHVAVGNSGHPTASAPTTAVSQRQSPNDGAKAV